MAFSSLLASADTAILKSLGGTVRYSPDGVEGSFVDVPGVFDSQHRRVDVLDAAALLLAPAVFLRVSDLGGNPEDHLSPTVEADGTRYRVREVKLDGLGGVLLLLQEMA